MSETLIQDRLITSALKKQDKNRKLLDGTAYKKWYRQPYIFFLLTVLALLVLDMTNHDNSLKFEPYLILAFAFSIGQYQVNLVNKRIDTLVELSGAIEKLEERCQSDIKDIVDSQEIAG